MNEIKKFIYPFIFLLVGFLFIPIDTFATEMLWTPYDIVIQQPGDQNVIVTPNKYDLNNLSYWSFPPNQSSDFATPASIYFRYNNGNNDYCVYQANNGSISGQFYASNSFTGTMLVRVQDRSVSTRPYYTCDSSQNGHYMSFTCHNLNLSHNFNFIISNASGQRYGIRSTFNVECSQTIEGAAHEISGAINSQGDKIQKEQKETNDLIKNDDTSSAQSTGSSFFNNFQRDSHGLSGIVTAPLRLLNSFTTATCNPLEFNLPIVHNHVVLPCMRPIYENYFGVFFSLYQLITTGVVCYGVGINLYSKLRALENPNNDKIEVLQL